MKQAKDLVSRINEQVLELLDRQRSLKGENADLNIRNKALEETVESQKNEIKELKEQIVKLKITRSLIDKKGSTEVKTKIDELLREIDKCLGLLNHQNGC